MRSVYVFLLIVCLAFALKAPFAAVRFRAYPDAVAYLNIAENLASGDGFTSTLKLHYFDDSPVTHCALSDWPPLYPALAGAALKAGLSPVGLQLMNALLAALAAGLVFLIADRLFGRRVAIVSGLFAAASPILFRSGITAMSDPLGLALALTAVYLAISADGRSGLWFAAGIVSGAAYLARFPNAILLPVFLVYTLKAREARNAALCALGFLLASGPVLVAKCVIYGSPFYCAQLFHYAAPSFSASAWAWNHGSSSYHLGGVLISIAGNAAFHAGELFAWIRGLFTLSLGLPNAFRDRKNDPRVRLIVWVAALNFAIYALTWSIPPVRGSRFMLLSYCLLLPVCIAGLERRKGKRLRAIAYTTTALACAYGVTTAGLSHDYEFRPLEPYVTAHIKRSLPGDANLASNNPWVVSYCTHRPTALLPRNLDGKRLREFVVRYDVRAVVILKTKRQSLTQMTLRGSVRAERVGSVAIYDVGGDWIRR